MRMFKAEFFISSIQSRLSSDMDVEQICCTK